MSREQGATLVEVLIAIALTGIMLPTLATALVTSHAGRASARQQLKATALLHEASEAVRTIRDADWADIATNSTYHLVIDNGTWTLDGGSESIDGFTRQVTISDARRDSSGALIQSGGGADPATKHVVISVAWSTPYSSSITGDLYLTHWRNSATWEQTTQADFTAGTIDNTTVRSSGEVELADEPSHQTAGTFTSSTLDAGTNAALYRLSFTADQPTGTDIKLQIATNNDGNTWNFVGPDGTAATYFTEGASIPLGDTNARYLRYKAFLTGGDTATPTLQDVEVKYAP